LILLLTLEVASALFDMGGQDVIVVLGGKQNLFSLALDATHCPRSLCPQDLEARTENRAEMTPAEARSSNTPPRQIVLAALPSSNFLAAWRFLPVSAMDVTSHNGGMF